MGQNVNSSMFKNPKNGGKKKNQLIPLIFIIVLALALVALQYFILDFNSQLMSEQQQNMQQEMQQQDTQ